MIFLKIQNTKNIEVKTKTTKETPYYIVAQQQ